MPRISFDEVDQYGGSGGGTPFFKLENDKEMANVRLLGHDMNDFSPYAVHEVEIGDKRKYVNCLRKSGDPKDVCPFCSNSRTGKVIVKLFIPLYNIDADEVQIWDRGKSIVPNLSGYVARHKDVVQWVTQIERHGKPKDTNTTYQFYDDGNGRNEDVTVEEFAEDIPDILGRYVLDKTADEMEYFLDNDEFPDDAVDDVPVRRRDSRDRDDDRSARRSSDRSNRRNNEGF